MTNTGVPIFHRGEKILRLDPGTSARELFCQRRHCFGTRVGVEQNVPGELTKPAFRFPSRHRVGVIVEVLPAAGVEQARMELVEVRLEDRAAVDGQLTPPLLLQVLVEGP